MPDLATLSDPLPLLQTLKPASDESGGDESLYAVPVKALAGEAVALDQTFSLPVSHVNGARGDAGIRVSELDGVSNGLDMLEKAMAEEKIDSWVPKEKRSRPLLIGLPKLVECHFCQRVIYPGEEVVCSVRDCLGVFHSSCLKGKHSLSSKKFKCPQHACFLCKQKSYWRCIKCSLASHDRCAAFPEGVIRLKDQPGRVICWRHPSDWRLQKKLETPATDVEEILCNLPLPYIEEEFKIDLTWKEQADSDWDPPSYAHIKRNIYLIKKKRCDVDNDLGCSNCTSNQCSEDCVCRICNHKRGLKCSLSTSATKETKGAVVDLWVQSISCSKACRCSETCTNRPFRRGKKIRLVKTEFCGWGIEAAESINEGEFVIEYVGEVINDAICIQRLWDMKYKDVKNFYLCEIEKNFIIDATYKGNCSRFLNHSCQPNCKLEKWQVDGETRIGIFAARSIKVGEALTYDYRFVQFGPEVKCQCGAPNCQGFLGTKKKVTKFEAVWGLKRKRTPVISNIHGASLPQTL